MIMGNLHCPNLIIGTSVKWFLVVRTFHFYVWCLPSSQITARCLMAVDGWQRRHFKQRMIISMIFCLWHCGCCDWYSMRSSDHQLPWLWPYHHEDALTRGRVVTALREAFNLSTVWGLQVIAELGQAKGGLWVYCCSRVHCMDLIFLSVCGPLWATGYDALVWTYGCRAVPVAEVGSWGMKPRYSVNLSSLRETRSTFP